MRLPAGLFAAVAVLLAWAAAGAAAETPVTPRAHVIQVAVPRDAEHPFVAGDEALVDLVRSAAAYWQQQSGGQITSFTVNPTVDTIPAESYADPCDSASLFEGAPRAYPSERFSSAPAAAPEHLVVLVPDTCVGHGGIATLGRARLASGGVVAITTAGSSVKARLTLIHELGHNFGLSHSYGAACGGVTAEELTGDCREQPYFGFTEIMSTEGAWPSIAEHAPPVLGAVFRAYLGLETAGESTTVDWVDQPERSTFAYDLRPRGEDEGLRAVRVADPYTGRRYVLEYRSGTGRDAGTFYASGETIEDTRPDGGPLPLTMVPGVAIQEDAAPSLDIFDGSRRPVWIYDRAAGTGNFGSGGEWFTPNRGLRVRVGAIDPGVSAPVEVTVFRRRVTATAPPTVSGQARVGETLRATVAGWKPTPDRCDYQWLADDSEIAGATGASLDVGADLVGARLRVRATRAVDGAAPVAALTSQPTAPVEPALPPAPDPASPGPSATTPAASQAPAPALANTPVSVPRSTPRPRLVLARATVGPRDRASIRVRLAAPAPVRSPGGMLIVFVDGRPVRRVLPSSAFRTLKLPPLTPGKHRIAVRYTGSPSLPAATSPIRILTVRPRG